MVTTEGKEEETVFTRSPEMVVVLLFDVVSIVERRDLPWGFERVADLSCEVICGPIMTPKVMDKMMIRNDCRKVFICMGILHLLDLGNIGVNWILCLPSIN